MYCCHCGASVASKRCSACGTKQGNGSGYCAWCGTALELGAAACPVCQEPTKKPSGFVKVLKVALSIFFFIMALGIFSDNVLASLLLLLGGVIGLPFFREWIKEKTHENQKMRKPLQWTRIIATILCFIIAFSLSSGSGSGSASSARGEPIVDSNGAEYSIEDLKTIAKGSVENKLLSFADRSLVLKGYCKIDIEEINYKATYGEIKGTVQLFDEDRNPVDKHGNYKEGKLYNWTVKIDRETLVTTCDIR